MPRNLMISGHLRFSFFSRCGTFVQRRSKENEIQAHSRQSHSVPKTTFSTRCPLGFLCPSGFCIYRYYLFFMNSSTSSDVGIETDAPFRDTAIAAAAEAVLSASDTPRDCIFAKKNPRNVSPAAVVSTTLVL